jgi:hypothetical protein
MKLIAAIFLAIALGREPAAKFVIVWHYPQCKDCVNEIGAFLNDQGIQPGIGLRLGGQPEIAVFARSREVAAQTNFGIDTIASLPDELFGERKYPYLLKIAGSDTSVLSYEAIYDERGKLQTPKLRSFIK